MIPSSRLLHTAALLLALCLGLPSAQAQTAKTPRQMIEDLDVEVRQILESSKPAKTPEEAERAVAEQITALIRNAEGHLSLTDADLEGRTPLMLAASRGFSLIVKALLADASVKLRINQPDRDGITAWMAASFAPNLTLVACEPGTLTRERYALLPPYLLRVNHLLKTKGSAIGSIVNQLEAAGADTDAEAAKRAWLNQCPNATPALREALANGDLMRTLISEAVTRQREFNETAAKDMSKLPMRPPEGMKFHRATHDSRGVPLPWLDIHQLVCVKMEKPRVGIITWSGTVVFRAVATTRAGVVEMADFELLSAPPPKGVADYFRLSILQALAGYQCKGDHTFEQEFEFRIS